MRLSKLIAAILEIFVLFDDDEVVEADLVEVDAQQEDEVVNNNETGISVDNEKSTHSLHESCNLLNLNYKGKNITEGRNNRKKMNKHVKLSVHVIVGEEVVFRDGFGSLKAINTDASIVITLQPWGYDETFKPKDNSRMRCAISLSHACARSQRTDAMSQD